MTVIIYLTTVAVALFAIGLAAAWMHKSAKLEINKYNAVWIAIAAVVPYVNIVFAAIAVYLMATMYIEDNVT